MALPSSGTITIAAIAAEIGVSLPLSLTATNVRQLCGVPSGTVTMPTAFYGKSWAPVSNLDVGSMSASAQTDGLSTVFAQATDTVIVTKGVAAFTYQWYITGGATIIGSSTGSTLTLRYTNNTPGTSASGTYYCRVTGANGVSANSNTGSYYLSIESL